MKLDHFLKWKWKFETTTTLLPGYVDPFQAPKKVEHVKRCNVACLNLWICKKWDDKLLLALDYGGGGLQLRPTNLFPSPRLGQAWIAPRRVGLWWGRESTETNSSPLKIGRNPKRKFIFQPSIFGGELLVSRRAIFRDFITTYVICPIIRLGLCLSENSDKLPHASQQSDFGSHICST